MYYRAQVCCALSLTAIQPCRPQWNQVTMIEWMARSLSGRSLNRPPVRIVLRGDVATLRGWLELLVADSALVIVLIK